MNNRAIGVFDSGLGGLTVVKEINKLLPNEKVVYLGDTARVPYGTRSGDLVREFSRQDAVFLLTKNIKCLVIACNTSSAYAAKSLKRSLALPVFEVITPPSREAVRISKSGKIGVIGTRGTISSKAYQRSIKKLSSTASVLAIASPLIVSFVEEAEFGKALNEVLKEYLVPFKGKIDTLILGCTHYPIVKDKIENLLGEGIALINPGYFVAFDLRAYLKEHDLLSDRKARPRSEFFVTDLTERFVKVAEMFLGRRLNGNLKKVTLGK